MTIIYWTAGWLGGIWLGSILNLPTSMWVGFGMLGLGMAIILRQNPLPATLLLFLAGGCLGAARYAPSRPHIDLGHIAYYNGQKNVTISGLVIQPPDRRETHQNLTVSVSAVTLDDGEERRVQGNVLLRAPRTPAITYGTRIQATGDLKEPASDSFDYRSYLAHRDIHTTMVGQKTRQLASGAGNSLISGLLALNSEARLTIQQLLPQPQAGLLSGILLGDDQAIPSNLQEDFRTSGMTHIIAISGFNIAIIAGTLLAGGRHVVGIRIAAWMAMAVVFIYAVFVGAEASVIRAAIMGLLMIVAATLLGRPTFLPAVLFSAAFFMTLLNPHILWDVGFQLSFAATLGLSLYLGPWSHSFHDLIRPVVGDNFAKTSSRFVSEIVLATAAATIMTFPLMIYHFSILSAVNPLANFLILPAQPGIMLWGGLATLAGLISPVLGQPFAWLAWLFLTYTIVLVRFFGSLPLAALPVKLPPLAPAAIYGFIFAAVLIGRVVPETIQTRLGRQLNGRVLKRALWMLILAAILAAVWFWQRPDGRLHVFFLDVGQGDAILVQGPDGKQMLVDGGQYPNRLLSQVGEQMPFWDKSIDLVVATHPDADHVAGLVDLFENYGVGQMITNGLHEEMGTGYFGVVAAARQADVPIRGIQPGETIAFGSEVQIEILHAGTLPGSSEDNDESIMMRLCYDDFSLLLTGDAGFAAEQQLLRRGAEVQSAVLKAGHHGSNTASGREFLQAVRPQIVIISGGGERYDHPDVEVLERIAETRAAVWRTDEMGTIELISDGRLIWSNAGSMGAGSEDQ